MKGLLDWLCALDDIDGVLGKFPWDTRHVNRLPSKDVPIFMEELDERAFLLGRKVDRDLSSLGWVLWVDRDLLGVPGRLEGRLGGRPLDGW